MMKKSSIYLSIYSQFPPIDRAKLNLYSYSSLFPVETSFPSRKYIPLFFLLMVNMSKNKQGYIKSIKTMNTSSDTKKGFTFYGTPQMLVGKQYLPSVASLCFTTVSIML